MDTSEFYDKKYFENRYKTLKYRPRIRRFVNAVRKYNPERVLDVGCGHGFLVKKLNDIGIDAIGIDFSEYAGERIPEKFFNMDITKKLPFNDDYFDVVVATDVLEHIPEDKLDDTVNELERVGKKVVALISFKPDKLKKGEVIDTHLTINPRKWWEKKLPRAEILW